MTNQLFSIPSKLALGILLTVISVPGSAEAPVPLEMPEPRLGPAPLPSHKPLPPEEPEERAIRASSFSKTGDFGIDDLSNRHLSKALYKIVFNASEGVDPGWTGDTDTCLAGDTTDTFKDSVLTRINFYRAMAGIPDTVTFNSTYSGKSQDAALMMSKEDQLSHYPGTSWGCYTADGDEAAGKSNLSLGNYGYDAVMSQIRDAGSNNAAVGHRRWILCPQTQIMGTGDVPTDGSYNKANSVWVQDSHYWDTRPTVRNSDGSVTWPPQGYVPYSVVYPRWSFSYPGADFSSASVYMAIERGDNDEYVPVTQESVSNNICENTLVWYPSSMDPSSYATAWEKPEEDTEYFVIISGVANAPQSQYVYSVKIFDPDTTGASEVSPTISGSAAIDTTGDTYTHTTLSFTPNDYEMRELSFQSNQGIEGAENGTTDITDGTDGEYDVIQSSIRNSGSYSFHMAHPNAQSQYFTVNRDFLVTSTSQLQFYSRLGYAAPDQIAKAYISLDGGGSWTELFSQSGSGGSGESSFSLQSISLSPYADKIATFKFAFEFSSGSYYPQSDAGVGFYVDDIQITNAEEVASAGSATSIGASGSFTYTPSGTGDYGIQVRAVPWSGFSGLDWGPVKIVTVSDGSPVAEAGDDQSASEGASVSLSGSATDSGGGGILEYAWDFGDGSTGAGQNVSHTFTDNGLYTVTLTVTNDAGKFGTDTLTVNVSNVNPVASAGEDQSANEGALVGFSGSATDAGSADTFSYAWTFGDGTTATGQGASHAYADNGIYTVTLTVTDDDGGVGTDTQTVTVANVNPVASAGDDQVADEGASVSFSGTATDAGSADTHSYAWNFGDGASAENQNPSHAYADNGVYTVTLTVTDDDGGMATDTQTVTVANVNPVASAGEDQTANEGASVSFSGSADDAGSADTHNYAWDFGDGAVAVGQTASHTYVDDGRYTVTLTATDDDGGSHSDTLTVTVENVNPVAEAGENQSVHEGDQVSFSGSATDVGSADTFTYVWDFGDGDTVTGQTAIHAYTDNGVYTVTLSVTDDDGGSHSDTLTVTVANVDPVANAGVDQSGEEGASLSFSASVFDAGSADTFTYDWDFGDGSTGNGQTTTHAYPDNGSYTVSLTVTDDDGGSHSDTLTVTVANVDPVADAGEDQQGEEGMAIGFTGSATDGGSADTHTYAWDFGDGNSATGQNTSHIYQEDGGYTVTLTVTDDDGGSGSDTQLVTIGNLAPGVTLEQAHAMRLLLPLYGYPDLGTTNSAWDAVAAATDRAEVIAVVNPDFGPDTASPVLEDYSAAIAALRAAGVKVLGYVSTGLTENPASAVEQDIQSWSYNYTLDGIFLDEVSPSADALDYYAGLQTFIHGLEGLSDALVVLNPAGDIDPAFLRQDVGDILLTFVGDEATWRTYSTPEEYLDYPRYRFAAWVHTVDTASGDLANIAADGIDVAENAHFGSVYMTDDEPGEPWDGLSVLWGAAADHLLAHHNADHQEGSNVTFDAFAIDPGVLDTHSYVWNFGDGTSGSGQSVSHIYADNGVYVVTVTATDDEGASASGTLSLNMTNVDPVAEAGEDQSANEGSTVSFSGSATDVGSADTFTYNWNFGDNQTATGQTVSHAYADNGSYTVTLTVTDDDGGVDSDTQTVTVANVDPVADAGADQSANEGDEVSFSGSATDAGSADTFTYAWNFGDNQTATGQTAGHLYADNGSYTVTLNVTDDDGGSHSDTQTVTVANVDPVANAGEDQTADEGASVSFTGAATDAGSADTHTYAWEFGDGGTASGETASHTYVDDGSYTVTLTVTDDDSGSHSDTQTVTVNNVDPVANAGDDQSANEGDEVSFSGSAMDAGVEDTFSYAWDFGDGTLAEGQDSNHTFADNGVYIVILSVTDDDGGSHSDTQTVTVANVAPEVTMGNTTLLPGSSTVEFHGSFTDVGTEDTHSYEWNFGDGVTTSGAAASMVLDTSHIFGQSGLFDITVSVTDDDGGVDSASGQLQVWTLNVAAGDGGKVVSELSGIDCETDCTESYAEGVDVTLQAVAGIGYLFDGWSGACSGDGDCRVSLDGDRSVTASFIADNLPCFTGPAVLTSTDYGSVSSEVSIESDGIVELLESDAVEYRAPVIRFVPDFSAPVGSELRAKAGVVTCR